MFSTVFGSEYAQNIINVEKVLKSLQNKGYSFFKSKRGQLQSGLSASSLMVQKNNLTIIAFAMKLGMRNIICACYHKSRLILERQLEYEEQIVDLIEQTYNNIKPRNNLDQNKVDIQVGKLRNVADRAEKNFKDFTVFSQEMKLSKQYEMLLKYQKQAYEKLESDCQFVIDNKKKTKQKNQELLEPLLKIQQNKQTLQNVILAYEDQKQYLSNPKSIFEAIIEEKKKNTDDLHVYLINQTMFSQYLEDLVEIEGLNIKLKTSGL